MTKVIKHHTLTQLEFQATHAFSTLLYMMQRNAQARPTVLYALTGHDITMPSCFIYT